MTDRVIAGLDTPASASAPADLPASAAPAAPAPAPAPSALDLLRAFRRCAHLQGTPNGSRGQGRILALLLREGPQTQRALADHLERTPATLSQQLDAMEVAGLVERRRPDEDRRTVAVSLTPAGEQAAREAVAERRRVADELFGDMDDADRRDLLRLLEGRTARWQALAASRPGVSAPVRPSAGAPTPAGVSAPSAPARPEGGSR